MIVNILMDNGRYSFGLFRNTDGNLTIDRSVKGNLPYPEKIEKIIEEVVNTSIKDII